MLSFILKNSVSRNEFNAFFSWVHCDYELEIIYFITNTFLTSEKSSSKGKSKDVPVFS
jgi:hypothetical protein